MRRFGLASLVLVAVWLIGEIHCLAQGDPQTFGAAWEKAEEAIGEMQAARLSATDLRTLLDQESNPGARAALQKKLDEQVQSAARIKQDLVKRVEAALKLVEATTAPEDVNRARYLQCYVKYDDGEYLQAAEIGEPVAMKHPRSEVARPCAKIALASYLILYSAKKVDAAKVSAIAKHIVATWPNHPDAAMAREVLDKIK